MTPEAQKLAIGTACGWVPLEHGKDHPDDDVWFNPVGGRVWRGIDLGTMRRGLPDYLNDLNAMHEAEKTLDVTNGGPTSGACLRYAYSREVYRIVPEWQQPFRADAGQRAEAFLRTLGKWTD